MPGQRAIFYLFFFFFFLSSWGNTFIYQEAICFTCRTLGYGNLVCCFISLPDLELRFENGVHLVVLMVWQMSLPCNMW